MDTFKSESLSTKTFGLIIASSALFITAFIFLALYYFIEEAWIISVLGFLLIYVITALLSALFFIIDFMRYRDTVVRIDEDKIKIKTPKQTLEYDVLNVTKYSVVRTFYGWFGYVKFNIHIRYRDKQITKGLLIKKANEYDVIESLKKHKKEAKQKNHA